MTIEEIPIQTYRALEQKIQDLRLTVLEGAQRLAAKEKTSHPVVSQDHIKRALTNMLAHKKGARSYTKPEPNVDVDVPQDAYLFLEGRLHRLRLLAASLVSQQPNPDPQHLESVWPIVREKLETLLLPDAETA